MGDVSSLIDPVMQLAGQSSEQQLAQQAAPQAQQQATNLAVTSSGAVAKGPRGPVQTHLRYDRDSGTVFAGAGSGPLSLEQPIYGDTEQGRTIQFNTTSAGGAYQMGGKKQKSGKPPKPAPAPAPPVSFEDPEIEAAALSERKRLRQQRGRASTMLAGKPGYGASGAGAGKTLLGE